MHHILSLCTPHPSDHNYLAPLNLRTSDPGRQDSLLLFFAPRCISFYRKQKTKRRNKQTNQLNHFFSGLGWGGGLEPPGSEFLFVTSHFGTKQTNRFFSFALCKENETVFVSKIQNVRTCMLVKNTICRWLEISRPQNSFCFVFLLFL